jgi:hypothetical protein
MFDNSVQKITKEKYWYLKFNAQEQIQLGTELQRNILMKTR